MNTDPILNIISCSYQDNFINCLCSTCMNCYSYDALEYHRLYDKCSEIRTCLYCNNIKINKNNSFIKNLLLGIYLFIFKTLISPITIIKNMIYLSYFIGQNMINISYPEFMYKSYYELQCYVNIYEIESYQKLSIDYEYLLKVNIIDKVFYIINYFLLTTYKHLYSNILFQGNIFILSLLLYFFYYQINICIFIIFCIYVYDNSILINICNIMLLTFINIPRIIITTILCICAYLAIIINKYIENILICKCVWPFINIKNYKCCSNSHKILLLQIDICHIFFRLILLLPIFTYYLLYCISNSIIVLIFGQDYEFNNTHQVGDLFEYEKTIFYPIDYKGTIIHILYLKIKNIIKFIIMRICRYIMILYTDIIHYIDYLIDYMIKKCNYMIYILFYNILNR